MASQRRPDRRACSQVATLSIVASKMVLCLPVGWPIEQQPGAYKTQKQRWPLVSGAPGANNDGERAGEEELAHISRRDAAAALGAS